jgi:hypothetical protein
VQITRTTPLRRMILHLLHIFLTDALTFMAASPCSLPRGVYSIAPGISIADFRAAWLLPDFRYYLER